MRFRRIEIQATGLCSLTWDRDTLVDWIGGYRYSLLGETERFHTGASYRFDSAVGLGGVGVTFETLGTKGLVLRDNGTRSSGNVVALSADLVREIDRSFYYADHYPFPVALLRHAGRVLLAHCPRGYNVLDLEDIDGRCLTQRPTGNVSDVFHSRLQASANGKWLLSNGWVWHPWRVACVYDVARALEEPEYLSTDGEKIDLGDQWEGEVEAATLLGERLVCATSEAEQVAISVYNLRDRQHESFVKLAEGAGTQMMGVDDDHVVLFDRHPRLLCLSSGELVCHWAEIEGTKPQPGPSYSAEVQSPPFLAMDPACGRFALGWPTHILAFVKE